MGNTQNTNNDPPNTTAEQGQLPPERRDGHNNANSPLTAMTMWDQPPMDYRIESARLQSYSNWPLEYMEPARMAAAGLYYTGRGDQARCFECGITIGEWEEGDNPMSDHRRYQSNCRFVRGLPCGYVPIGVNPNTVTRPNIRIHYGDECWPNTAPSSQSENEPTTARTIVTNTVEPVKPMNPTHPEFTNFGDRLESFQCWPRSMPQTKEQLAEAGFYYEGTGDRTICYHCGGGLNDWQPEDDPWHQHAKWFKNCRFVLMVKGQDFIDNIVKKPATPGAHEEPTQVSSPSRVEEAAPSTSQDHQERDTEEKQVKTQDHSTKEGARDAYLCKICYDEEMGIVFSPCGHMVACVKCARQLQSCAVCREKIQLRILAILA